MPNCSIALQILPLDTPNKIAIIDKVIAYLMAKHKNVVVCPFETVIEGDFEDLMTSLKEVILIAGKECNNVFANVKINYGSILTIDEKITKFAQ